ncbi:prepilin-type N-terminal cleavage/methylation domain-containing protein [Candidatus Saccharibacteria bacterium]|nr:prepilin-type N-terminal cleavage/methylation domain-containing protein [Candidatus Saccharibacteria bacterium]
MSKTNEQAGFTIVELLITLFVAAAFLVSGFQLYNLVIKDGGQTRADARASNVAYDYMRRYSATVVNPCVVATPLTNSAITVTGLSTVTVTVAIACPFAAATSVSKVNVTVLYNTPQQTMKYSNYVKK